MLPVAQRPAKSLVAVEGYDLDPDGKARPEINWLAPVARDDSRL
ncbi:MAG: hypothetical protein WA156_04350 [Methylocystis silviterrae]